ncbi:hypothetical protein D3C83_125170 [compost metagenome]
MPLLVVRRGFDDGVGEEYEVGSFRLSPGPAKNQCRELEAAVNVLKDSVPVFEVVEGHQPFAVH